MLENDFKGDMIDQQGSHVHVLVGCSSEGLIAQIEEEVSEMKQIDSKKELLYSGSTKSYKYILC